MSTAPPIFVGTSRLPMDYTDAWACVKARFSSETDGALSVTAGGSLRVFENELPNDPTTIGKLESDSLDLTTLAGMYRVSADASIEKTAERLECFYCKGGFVETSPVSVQYAYLKRPVIKATGNHTLNGGANVVTRAEWETPVRPMPPVCEIGDSSNIRTWGAFGWWLVREASETYLCGQQYRGFLGNELKEDLPEDEARDIADRVTSLFIFLW